jgi:hypothetical protein
MRPGRVFRYDAKAPKTRVARLRVLLDLDLGALGASRGVVVVTATLLGITVAVLEVVSTLLPIVVIGRTVAVAAVATIPAVIAIATSSSTATSSSASSTSTTSATVTAEATAAPSATATVAFFLRLEPLRGDTLLLALHLAVLLLGHDGKLVVVILWLRVKSDELLCGLFVVELDEDAALPRAVFLAALANHDGAVGSEELLKRDLADIFTLGCETLSVDAVLELVKALLVDAAEKLIDIRRVLSVAIALGYNQRLLALHGLFTGAGELSVVDDDKVFTLAKRVYDRRVGREAAHALELADVLD